MRVGILGGGRAAWALAAVSRASGWEIVGVHARSRAALFQQHGLITGSVEAIVRRSELLLLAVPDAAIAAVSAEAHHFGDPMAFHVSGCLPGAVMPFSRTFSLHPLRALPAVGEPVELAGTLFVFEGCADAEVPARALAAAAGGTFTRIESAMKPTYHAAAVIASNYVATLLSVGEGLLRASGVNADSSGALGTLARSAVANWERNAGELRFTGPLVRGDVDCVKTHLDALAPLGETGALYELLGRALLTQLSDSPVRKQLQELLTPGASRYIP